MVIRGKKGIWIKKYHWEKYTEWTWQSQQFFIYRKLTQNRNKARRHHKLTFSLCWQLKCSCRAFKIYYKYLYKAISLLRKKHNQGYNFLNIYQIDVHCVKIHALIDVLRWHHHILHYWLLVILHESRASATEEYTYSRYLLRNFGFLIYCLSSRCYTKNRQTPQLFFKIKHYNEL